LFSDQISANCHYLVYLHNEPKFMRNVSIISGIVNVILNLVAVPILGITGAALATFCSYLLLDFLIFRRVISYGIKVSEIYDLVTIAKFTLAALIMIAIVYFAMQFIELSFAMTLGMAAFGGLIYLVALLANYGFKVRRIFASI
jgi:O-antigen/teichoic acid export membrane protein